jgi:hypothetical protein
MIICANFFPQKKPLYLLYWGCFFFVAMTQILAKNKNTSCNGHEIIILL